MFLSECALGDRAGLARTYAQLQETLHAELDAEPLAGTTSLYQELINRA